MRKFLIVLVFVLGAAAAFVLGRLSATGVPMEVSSVREAIPLFPAPPKDTGARSNTNSAAAASKASTDGGLVLETPANGAALGASFEVSGRSDVPGGAVSIRITDPSGEELFSGSTTVGADNGAGYGRFSQTAEIPDSAVPGTGILEVSVIGPPVGPNERRQISFYAPDTMPINVFLTNNSLNQEAFCDRVFPVKRVISSQGQTYRLAIEALFDGPTSDEKVDGYATSVPAYVKLKSVAADAEGTVRADFDSNLERNVAGSCRPLTIRAQITETLKQFPEVKDVIISVNGQEEGVLEP